MSAERTDYDGAKHLEEVSLLVLDDDLQRGVVNPLRGVGVGCKATNAGDKGVWGQV